MSVLILAEHYDRQLQPATFSCVRAAQQLPGPIDVLVMGDKIDAIATELSKIEGIASVLMASAPYYANLLAEDVVPLIQRLAGNYQYFIAPATTFGKNSWPRLAACLDVEQVSDITQVLSANTFERPIYAGNAYQQVQVNAPQMCLTIRPTAFVPVEITTQIRAKIETIAAPPATKLTQYLSCSKSSSERPSLSQAKRVVSGGTRFKKQRPVCVNLSAS